MGCLRYLKWLLCRRAKSDSSKVPKKATPARAALELAEAPGRFLSTVQIGIALIGILTGALGGATLSKELAAGLSRIPFLLPYSQVMSISLIVLVITFLSLVIGELVPKRIALAAPERISRIIAPPMQTLSRITVPIVYVLDLSTEAVLRAIGVQVSRDQVDD